MCAKCHICSAYYLVDLTTERLTAAQIFQHIHNPRCRQSCYSTYNDQSKRQIYLAITLWTK